ncbi:glycosyltransferase family 2 protein [Aeribacillus composti]|uniref:Glycosyltransferase family 2 protein n=1 Tax=Aeribacillus composti TaxID=1868734 RepID=A0ABY9W9Y7_9BACI|nr:glycosyltransferase family 2 protein [Aeribacillus composti]WNF32951.1 glycosyltransferase family 2 protein [Aeribacillus composti]
MEIDFSLIVATYGREKEFEKLLYSLSNVNYNLNKIEIIILDQNDKNDIDLEKIIKKFPMLNINHIYSDKKGSSYNRNLGIKKARGKFIAFPDDDCEYFPETLNKVYETFKLTGADLVIGRIIDKFGNNVIRNWPNNPIKVNKRNFYDKYSAITIFYRKSFINNLFFDEKLGPGNIYGACEDTDLVYRSVKLSEAYYNPEIEVFHPDTTTKYMSLEKVKSYALGFGAFVRKNADFWTVFLFIKVIIYHTLHLIKYFISREELELRKRRVAIIYRFKGFMSFKLQNNK